MAHMLEIVDGVAHMAYAGEKPWHRLGFEVSNDLTPIEMMKAARVDWEVQKIPATAKINGVDVDTGHSALVRSSDNKVLDVITNDWNPTQNVDAFEFFREFTEAGHMNMHTAGSLDGGRNVWALAKINESFEPVKGDVINGHLLFSNPHKYGTAVTVRFTPIRVVCNNTLSLALSSRLDEKMSVSVNHRRAFDADLVKEALGIASAKLKKYEENARFLSIKPADKDAIRAYINQLFPTTSEKKEISRPAETILSVVDSQPGVEFGEGTWWQAFNAVTYAIDHKLGRSDDTRLNSAWFGVNASRKQKALVLATELANAA